MDSLDYLANLRIRGNSYDEEYMYFERISMALASIAKYVGNFPRWTELPPELQMTIIGNMDYKTRTSLSFCSKQSYAIVNSTPVEIHSITVSDVNNRFEQLLTRTKGSVSVEIVFDDVLNDFQTLRLFFINQGNDTEIKRNRQDTARHSITRTNSDYYEEAVKFVESWLKKSRLGPRHMKIDMKRWPLKQSQIQFLKGCEEIDIKHEDEEVLKLWLGKVRPELKILILSNGWTATTSTKLLSMDHFKKCDNLHAWGKYDFTDEQFLSMTAKSIVVDSNTITDGGINKFIKNWLAKIISKDFQFLTIYITRTAVKEVILEDITFRRWDENFERDSQFCKHWKNITGRGNCSQIERNDGTSATLNVGEKRITFCVTGQQVEKNGKTIVKYECPVDLV